MAAWTLGETWSARSCFAASTSSDHRYLVCASAKEVEEQVVDEQRCPWTDSYEAEEELVIPLAYQHW
jgi:hypothetical protein